MTDSLEPVSAPPPGDDDNTSTSSSFRDAPVSPPAPQHRRRASSPVDAGIGWKMPGPLKFSIANMIPIQSIAEQASVRIAEQTSRAWLPGVQAAVDAFSARAASVQLQQRSALALSLGSMAGASHLSILGQSAATQSARRLAEIVRPTPSLPRIGDIVGPTSTLLRMADVMGSMPKFRSAGLAGLVSAAESHRLWATKISEQMRLNAAWRQADHSSSIVADVNRLFEGLRPQMLGIAEAIASMTAQLTQPFTALGQLGLRVVQSAIAFGERAYFAVLAAQDAAARGDISAVGAFLQEWLGLPRSRWRERVQAGMDVLMDTRLEEYGPDTAFQLLDVLEKRANRHFRRGCRSLEETRLYHLRVVSIDALPGAIGRPDLPSEHFLPASRSAEDRVLFALNQAQDDRLEAVLGSLTPAELRVVWAKGIAQTSWQEASVMCGLRAQEGERIRAKVARRAKQVKAIAAGPTSPFWR